MLALEEWAIGRWKPVAMLAQVVASSAEDCYELLQQAHSGRLRSPDAAASITPKAWARQYRQPYRLAGELLGVLFVPEQMPTSSDDRRQLRGLRRHMLQEFKTGMRNGFTHGCDTKTQKRAKRWLDLVYSRVHVPHLRRSFADGENVPSNANRLLGHPELVFFLTVAVPCWLETRKTPWELRHQAIKGDPIALETLLRIDPDAQCERGIAQRLFQMRSENPAQREALEQAARKRPRPLSLLQVKYLLGGLLMNWSEELERIVRGEWYFELVKKCSTRERWHSLKKEVKAARREIARKAPKCRLYPGEIKALFNAVATDSGQGLADPDFCQQPRAYQKRLKANMNSWPELRRTNHLSVA